MDVSVGFHLIDERSASLPGAWKARGAGIPLLRRRNQIRLMDFIGWNDAIPWRMAKRRVKG